MNDSFETRIEEALRNPENLGEMADADAVGTVGSSDCGDMVRMWLKFGEDEGGAKVIDKASFQSFGCQTAIAVASVATRLLAGKTVDEALNLSAEELSEPLGPLPPMKIHCGEMVEGALREALAAESGAPATATGAADAPETSASGLAQSLAPSPAPSGKKMKIVPLDESESA